MELQTKTCSSKEHEEINAISYCANCKVFMCNKCEKFHSNLLKEHKVFNINIYLKDNFTGFCNEKSHFNELEYFCKTHNILCCAACIAKVKNEYNGKHNECVLFKIDDIINEKKDKLGENINSLQNLSDKLKDSINDLKNLFEKMTKSKEELKINIQKIFTKIRNELNCREEKLLEEVEAAYENTFFKEEMLRECEKLPHRVKLSLEKGKQLEKENDDKKAFLINECIKIENNLKEIHIVNENVIKFNKLNKIKIKFSPEEDEINNELERIKSFGKLDIEKLGIVLKSSSIINDDINKQNTIINWIKSKVNKNEISFKLIFKMTVNGYEGKNFHQYCDNKGPTLILIKTTKDRIFGGFTPLDWENSSKSKYDNSNQTFIFSLNLNKKFDMISVKKKAIQGFSADYGPNFGDYDFGLQKNLREGMTYANSSCNYLSKENLELTGGKGNDESFQTEEFEVFQVIYQ